MNVAVRVQQLPERDDTRLGRPSALVERACLAGIWICLKVEAWCEAHGAGDLDTRPPRLPRIPPD